MSDIMPEAIGSVTLVNKKNKLPQFARLYVQDIIDAVC